MVWSDDQSIEYAAIVGKVDCGAVNNRRKVDVRIMQDEAIFQFVDRGYKIISETKKTRIYQH